jgi:predicted PhzF superfamily epimerase YddE/YHI9
LGRGDPATGSANGALVACLVHHRSVPVTEPTAHIVSEQGAELGQPNTLYVEVTLPQAPQAQQTLAQATRQTGKA